MSSTWKTALALLLAVSASERSFGFGFTPHFQTTSSPYDTARIASAGSFVTVGRVQASSRALLRSTQLEMSTSVPAVKVGIAALAGVIGGGVAAGGLHAVAGPDHLAALLPRCCGQRWFKALKVGALWGMGHGISATILGVVGFGLKNRIAKVDSVKVLLTGASSVMEIAVGVSLIFIGIMGMKEAREWKAEIEVEPKSLSAAAADAGVKETRNRSVIFNGLLHGFSWDGAPSLAPAIAVATWKGNITFLLSYAIGTMATMSITTTLIGEGSRRAGEILNRPDIPQKLSYVSSFVALLVGAVWVGLAFK